MAPLSSPRCPTMAGEASGPSTLEAEAEAGQGSTMALQALSSQVQKLVADQASSHQQVQQIYASQVAVQWQMQALMAQLQNPTPTMIPTVQVVPPSTHTSPAPPPAQSALPQPGPPQPTQPQPVSAPQVPPGPSGFS